MALKDMGYIDFEEPFTKFFAHGLVIKEGAKMSKSKGNIINPDVYINKYGIDALRLYLMFMGPYSQGGDFRDAAMEGMSRWVGRVWRMAMSVISVITYDQLGQLPQLDKPSRQRKHSSQSSATIHIALQKAIKKVTEDTESRRYNTAIATMMEFTNLVADEKGALLPDDLVTFIKLLAPYAPFLTEELWFKVNHELEISSERFGADKNQELEKVQNSKSKVQHWASIHTQPWPGFDEAAIMDKQVVIIVQINGKHRDTIPMLAADGQLQKKVEEAARASQKVAKYLIEGTVARVIFVSGKLINFVVKP